MQPSTIDTEKNTLIELKRQLSECRLQHQQEYNKYLVALKQRNKKHQPIDKSLVKLSQKIALSLQHVKQLDVNCPIPTFPEELPLTQRVEDISNAIENHQVVIIAGETGSGKTTQIPKICLKLGRGRKGLIGHTQPRRLAARTVSTRIAEELKVKHGEQVGYKIRFDDTSSNKANIRIMTDGMLLAEMMSDRLLLAYDTLIIDEAHERSLNIDFILGYLHRILNQRPDLKLIITSATIDPQRFSEHFSNAPIIEVSGRTFPVEVFYRPLIVEASTDDEQLNEIHREPLEAMSDAVDELIAYGRGDILIFLPGEKEIRDAAAYLRKRFHSKLEVFPLYSRLSKNEQDKIFKQHANRRIVLATNVAETSLTVPSIRYVIDTGVARISRYSQRTKVQQLPIEAISQASANQRKGRCGRLEDGICIRLYSEEDFNSRKEFTDAEIHRTNLASVILKMLDMDLGDIEQFPFVEPPESKRISDGFRLLQNLQVIDEKFKITPSGKKLAKFPIDPRFGKMLLTAEKYGCVKDILIIVSALSVQDIRERPLEKRQQADEFHKRFNTVSSDFVSLLNIWKYCHQIRQDLSSSAFRKRLSKEFLSFLRLRDWMETYRQLSSLCKQIGLKFNQTNSDYSTIHKCIISGMPDQLGNKSADGDYMAARNSRFLVNRQSAAAAKLFNENFQELFKDKQTEPKWVAPFSKWVVAAELVETQKIYARQVASIETQWVIEVASPLIKKRYFDPFWSQKVGCCKAYLQQSIFGLILEAKTVVNYEIVDKGFCRELFLREGIIARKINTRIVEIKQFWLSCDEIEAEEDKVRRRDRLLDIDSIIALLDSKIPADIVSIGQLHKWYNKASTQQRQKLSVTVNELLRGNLNKMPVLPEFWQLREIQLPISYLFEPGTEDDGMTVQIPLAILASLNNSDFEYLIPSLLRQKIMALLKGLPKRLRKNFVPVPEYTDALLERMNSTSRLEPVSKTEKLLPSIVSNLKQITGVTIAIDDFDERSLPRHLQVNFNIVDDHGKSLAKGRDLNVLQQMVENNQWKSSLPESLENAEQIEEERFISWPKQSLEKSIESIRAGIKIKQYMGLKENLDDVSIKLFSSSAEARYETQRATIRLLLLNMNNQVIYLTKQLPEKTKLSLSYSSIGNFQCLLDDLCWFTVKQLIAEEIVQTHQQFEFLLEKMRNDFIARVIENAALLLPVLSEMTTIKKLLKGKLSPLAIASYQDISSTMEHLIYPDFLQHLTIKRLKCYPRYLISLQLRLNKLPQNSNKERAYIESMNQWRSKLSALERRISAWSIEQNEYYYLRWMLDELSVSLFSQELGTEMTVSEKRLAKQYASLVESLG